MHETSVVQSENIQLRSRRITAPARYSCYESYPASDEEREHNENPIKNCLKKCKQNQKSKTAEVNSTTLNALDTGVVESVPSSKDCISRLLEEENVNEETKKYGANAYVCPECGKVLRSKDTLLRHRISHSGLKPFLCEVCDQGFSSAVSLKEHKARHENKTLYECKICSKSFRQNSCYHRHMATHSKTYVHVCEICSKRFSSKDYLRSHMKSHSNEKRYACDQCNKRFARVSDLNRHKILHTNARPYSCSVCGLTFADSSSCRRHAKDHDSNKLQRYHCKQCNSSFKKPALLAHHVKKHKESSSPEESVSYNLDSVSNYKELQEIGVEKGQVFGEVNLLLAESALPCSELSDNVACNKQLSLPKQPLCESEECSNYINAGTYNDSLLSIQTTASAVFKVVGSEIDISSYDTIQDVFYYDGSQMQKNQVSLSLHDDNLSAPRVDYIAFPDFHSQDYYSWLSGFNAVCKLLPFPLDADLFTKISQVQKSILDTLSIPSEILCNKSNFKVLRSISDDLYNVISGHLNFIYDHLKE